MLCCKQLRYKILTQADCANSIPLNQKCFKFLPQQYVNSTVLLRGTFVIAQNIPPETIVYLVILQKIVNLLFISKHQQRIV